MRFSRGNAFFITLICVVLLGAVTFVVSRQMSSGSAQTILPEKYALFADRLVAYISTAQLVYAQMKEMGVASGAVDITAPSAGSFNTPPVNAKLFHPGGGGLAYFPKIPVGMSPNNNAVWQVSSAFFEWSPTGANDIFFVLKRIDENLCAAINKQITGSTTIPSSTAVPPTASDCPTCNGEPMLCLLFTTTSTYQVYAMVAAE